MAQPVSPAYELPAWRDAAKDPPPEGERVIAAYRNYEEAETEDYFVMCRKGSMWLEWPGAGYGTTAPDRWCRLVLPEGT